MRCDDGELMRLAQEDVDKMSDDEKKNIEPVPPETKVDTICKLQNKLLSETDRRSALRKLNKKMRKLQMKHNKRMYRNQRRG
jgi:hypothetical protein